MLLPPFYLSKVEAKIIRKRQVHNNRVTERFNSSSVIVYDKVVLLVLVVSLVLECEPHPEDSLL